MTRRTKALAISPEVKRRVLERDGCCVYCGRPGAPNAHYIPRSQGGLGIEENILTLCTACHQDYDFGPHREEMGDFFRKYLAQHYLGWDELKLYYRK